MVSSVSSSQQTDDMNIADTQVAERSRSPWSRSPWSRSPWSRSPWSRLRPRAFANSNADVSPGAALLLWGLVALGLLVGLPAGDALAQKKNRPSSLLNFQSSALAGSETDGYMVGGDYWNTVKPLNSADNALPGGLGNTEQIMLFGSTQNLQSPNGLWPGGYRFTQTFRNAMSLTFPTFKSQGWPGYKGSNPVFAADGTEDTGGEGGSSRFMFATYSDEVAGADDPARNYTRKPRFTDGTRTHLVYEAGFPTTAGIDFRIRAHQFTPNTQNMNDFIVLEVTMINTGEVDSDADGELEATGNTIDGVAMNVGTSPAPSIHISDGGDRDGNGYENGGARVYGYVATPDETGTPYNLYTYWKGVPPVDGQNAPPEGERSMGINFTGNRGGYTDIWNGWQFMGVKQGAIDGGAADTRDRMSYPSTITSASPDKETLFGTDPVGEGEEEGWYTSSQWHSSLASSSASDLAFWNATATWYENYGRTTDARSNADLSPNSNFFSGGDPVDITTFEPGPRNRPNGDYKYASEEPDVPVGIAQPIWEDAWNPEASSGNFFGGVGYTRHYNFTDAVGQGIGPFKLEPGEAMTVVWVAAAGYRFEGVDHAVEAARWAWERGWDIRSDLPVPAAPDLDVESTNSASTRVNWTDVEGVGGGSVDGYKVWRAAQYRRTAYLDAGMRLMDHYQWQQDPEKDDREEFKEPVNPYFSVNEGFFTGDAGLYQPAEWGDYQLLARLPAEDLGSYASSREGFDYAYEDSSAVTGFTYWYYVSAYDEGTFTGPQGEVAAGHIESSDMNRNGRNAPQAAPGDISLASLWGGTYPFAFKNVNYPDEGSTAHQNLGASFTLVPPAAEPSQAQKAITVTPNPYKRTALNDERSDASSHNVNFLNMPEDFTLTIIDVSGQIVYQDVVRGAPNGLYTWDLFSKSGTEVASGLYIYHIKFGDGREKVGHLAILR